jgi:hypothetical protein
MTDFFKTVSQMALGRPPAIQPLIASRYAPGPDVAPTESLPAREDVFEEKTESPVFEIQQSPQRHKEHKEQKETTSNSFEPDIPLLTEEGWTRHQEDVAKPPLHERLRMQARQGAAIKEKERTGWWVTSRPSERVPKDFGVADHPVSAASEASQYFLNGGATPYEEGNVPRENTLSKKPETEDLHDSATPASERNHSSRAVISETIPAADELAATSSGSTLAQRTRRESHSQKNRASSRQVSRRYRCNPRSKQESPGCVHH